MRIQHNIMAMNAYRNYNTNVSALSSNLEKLSSGYKINRAGDDAAGLAISEKMRAQITGLEAAQKNVKDGISLVKTGEGAMQEIQDMLNRMDYLATQSANGTYDDDVDRANLQKEVDALKAEIDRIADSANFNGIKLLDGSLETGAAVSSTTSLVSSDHLQLHEAGAEATYASFEIDLNQLLSGAVATSTIAKDDQISFKITVGSFTATITATASATIAVGELITTKIGSFSATAATGTNATLTDDASNTVDFGVSLSSGVLTFSAASASDGNGGNPPAANFNAALAVTYGSASGGFAFGPADYDENCATQNVKTGVAEGGTQLAHTQFELTADMVKKLAAGATLTLGTSAVTFDDSTVTTSAGAVGVKDLLDSDGNIKTDDDTIAEIAARITRAANGDSMFTVGANGNTIEVQEKIDYYTATNGAVLLDTAEKLGKYVQLSSSGTGKALTLQIGDTSDSYNQLAVSIGDMHTTALGIGSIDISNQAGAQSAIQTIRDAINKVSSVRGDLGATQNRLEHTANNLSVMAENIQDAESTIRDTDVAEEMMAYTKNNILVQSAQAMLAQANAVPQGVLQLLG